MPGELPISVLLLARDESSHLEELLPLLGFAREIVVVWDAAGDPATSAIAKAAGASVHARELDGFGAQRQFGLEQCQQPWVLWIDADERLPADAAAVLGDFLAAPHRAAGTFERVTHFLGAPIRFCGWQRETLVRLFPRAGARFDGAPVHERLQLPGMSSRATGLVIEHRSYETWDQCVGKPVHYARLGAERAFASGRRASGLEVFLRPPLRFLRMYLWQWGVLDGTRGVLVCGLGAWQVFLKYAGLWELSRRERVRR